MTKAEALGDLRKLSLERLEEIVERETKILKNRNLVEKLPDKGEQLKKKLEKIKMELQIRQDIQSIETSMNTLSINCADVGILKEKHVQYVCNLEKSPVKERYKPFSTLRNKEEKEKPTQLISLTESILLLSEQATKLPITQVKATIEGNEGEDCDDKINDGELIELS